MNKRGMLIILSGPSGCGKGTVVKELLSRRDDTVLSVSVTTRSPRPGEVDGTHYFFRTKEQFEEMIQRDELLEYASYSGNYYGTPLPPIEEWLNAGKNVLLEIEVQGAQKVMERCPDHVSVFIAAPSLEVLEQRLRGRGTEAEEVIERRLNAAKEEMATAERYRYYVVNDEVELAVQRIETILAAESMCYHRMK
ncbi:MAG: guanylate kinase [Clostridia bacterium]|nr:guanylate kinase [Clostridia bacterium]